jgi:endonuclease/exonuclease/phosphatase family metal-dependent hydrolase
MQDSKVLSSMLSSMEESLKVGALPFERYLMNKILSSMQDTSHSKQARILQDSLADSITTPFFYVKGGKKEKSFFWRKKLTLLSWNVCLFNENLSMLFGGVLPWKDRIDRIVAKIQTVDPDILCLQEVFSPQAGKELVQKLSSQYAHFYMQIGARPAGFSLESLGISSGLFVASKYPLNNVNFTPYTQEQTPAFRGYGFFSADIYNKKKMLGHLIATHLQPGCEKEDMRYRAAQMASICASLQDVKSPVFLCGDFNIEKNSPEAEVFKNYEQSHYKGLSWTCCELRSYWWKAKENVAEFCLMPLEKEWLDYFLGWNLATEKNITMRTQVHIVNDPQKPQEALSDHQMLETHINF